MSDGEKTELKVLDAPYNKMIKLEDLAFESGMHLMRVTIREGTRITQLDLDPATAKNWSECMTEWANAHIED